MQKFMCIGRLTRDPELTTTNSGIAVLRFGLAVNRKFKDENGENITDFFNIVAWRGLAENINKYCKKGSKVFIAGELQNRSWEKDDGTKAFITEVIANECEFLDNKGSENSTKADQPKLEPIDDDSLPF